MKRLCPICKLMMKEKLVYVSKDYFLCNTKDLHGHKFRYMLCSYNHKPHIFDWEGLSMAVAWGLRNIKVPFVVQYGDKASIPEHWHVILTDRNMKGEKVDVFSERHIAVFSEKGGMRK